MSSTQNPDQMMRTQTMGDKPLRDKPLKFPGKRSIYSVFHMVIGLFAIYLSFKCNGGLVIGDFLIALCCPILYIIYRFAVSETFCGLKNVNVN
jgi:hypothetical protein